MWKIEYKQSKICLLDLYKLAISFSSLASLTRPIFITENSKADRLILAMKIYFKKSMNLSSVQIINFHMRLNGLSRMEGVWGRGGSGDGHTLSR